MTVEIQNLDDEFYHRFFPDSRIAKGFHHRGTEDSKVGMDLSCLQADGELAVVQVQKIGNTIGSIHR